MNERIRELVLQAGIELPNNVVDGVNGPGVVSEKDKLEKFAELIVKETMQVVANHLPSNQYLDVAHAVIEHYKDNDVT